MKMHRFSNFPALVAAISLAAASAAAADVLESSSGKFGGLYKVASSNDPIFPATKTREYFLDFGRGIQADKSSGSVAVSMRMNPNVRVRILAWQYFPEQGKIVLGNPFAEGSGNAVARGAWDMKGIANGVLFQRGNYRVVLQRADAADY